MNIKQKLLGNKNCIQLFEWECNGEACGYWWLATQQGNELTCPVCGCSAQSNGAIIIGRQKCEHTVNNDGHAYVPNE